VTNIEREVLSFMSPTPVPLSTIAADLGYTGQKEVSEAIKMLRGTRGLALVTGNATHGRSVWADPRYWGRIKKRAETAWAELEEDNHPTERRSAVRS
jgi:biotin operon repressor